MKRYTRGRIIKSSKNGLPTQDETIEMLINWGVLPWENRHT